LTQTPAVGRVRDANYVYQLCGLKFASQFDLPALPKWDGAGGAPDVTCRLGDVPSRLDRPNHIAPIFQTSGAGEYLLVLPGTGRILVRNGNEITVQPDAAAPIDNLGAILTGLIQAVLWHQRGLLPLHASVVAVDGRAVALCGLAAAGKSTLAALLARQGWRVIADDICVVDLRAESEVLVLPAGARLLVWRDALTELGVSDGLERALPHKERYFLDCGNGIPVQPYRLTAVVQVMRGALPPAAFERLRGSQVADVLYGCVHSPRPAKALGRMQPIFSAITRMSSAGVGVWRLRAPEGLVGLREAAAKLHAMLGG
jgi:hypothetical protein